MTQNRVLKNMLKALSDALSDTPQKKLLLENYEHQCDLYEKLLLNQKSESDLVCGRCLIALSRSLASERINDKSVCAVKNEVEILNGVFSKGSRPNKKQIEQLVRSRIEELSLEPSDAVYDAILFLYLSLR